jgi:thiol-disulfide isomerase/thioredoxin
LNTASTEQKLLAKLEKPALPVQPVAMQTETMPPLTGATLWLNSPELSADKLRGKVVLVDFWTYSCINCLRTLPYIKAWNEKYRDQGLVIIGVHAPEFAFEKDQHNVEKAVHDLGITYPVALDNRYAIWNAYKNQYWPAHYLIDAKGVIRDHHFGEGGYDETEKMIQTLLKEAGHQVAANDLVKVSGTGATEAAADTPRSPETYLGYTRQENLASPEPVQLNSASYSTPHTLKLDQWALSGRWLISAESATLQKPGGAISYHFQGRDLHLVLGSEKPVRIKVTLDGAAPGDNHGSDIAPDGTGIVQGQRLYQLIRQNGKISDHTFRIEFPDAGAQAFAFTFG